MGALKASPVTGRIYLDVSATGGERYSEGRNPHSNYPVGVEGGNKRPPFKAGENAEDEKRRARKIAKKKT